MDELAGTENRLSAERMRYNDRVREYDTMRRQFPAESDGEDVRFQGVSVLPGAAGRQGRAEGELQQVTLKETVLSEFDDEVALTRRLLDRLPDAEFSWKPHERSMSLGGLATHLAQIPHWGTSILQQDGYDLEDERRRAAQSSNAPGREVLETFDRHSAEVRRTLVERTDAELTAPWALKSDGHLVMSLPRVSALRRFLLNHLVHHRGQLTRVSAAAERAAPAALRSERRRRHVSRRIALLLAAAAFGLAATANSGGYRYGVSDQAFYAPPSSRTSIRISFRATRRLLATESRLMWSDEIVAGSVARPASGPAAAVSGSVRRGPAGPVRGGLPVRPRRRTLDLGHRCAADPGDIPPPHRKDRRELPRRLHAPADDRVRMRRARARGSARRAVQPRRDLDLGQRVWHPTTAFWFAIVVGVAIVAARPRWRRAAFLLAGMSALLALWAVLRGPLSGRLVIMDPAWLSVLAEKDYLFPHEWPAYAWVANLAYPIIVLLIFRLRRARGVAVPAEGPLVAGLIVLVAFFVLSLPFTMIRMALAVQMQVTRVFWILDFTTAAYLAWWLMDDRLRHRRVGRAGRRRDPGRRVDRPGDIPHCARSEHSSR